MAAFLTHLLLIFIWVTASGDVTLTNLLFGAVLGYVILLFVQRVTGETLYTRRVWKLFVFLGFFLWELLKANLHVAYHVFMPTSRMDPGVIAVPLSVESDLEITLFSNLLSLTPGTLGLDVSDDHRVLYVHALSVHDPDRLRSEIKDGFERRLLEVLR